LPEFAHRYLLENGEFTGSLAKGEWQSCLSSLVRLRAAHPGVELGGF
jgi:hypothetical protein